jgi:hypothetical protein
VDHLIALGKARAVSLDDLDLLEQFAMAQGQYNMTAADLLGGADDSEGQKFLTVLKRGIVGGGGLRWIAQLAPVSRSTLARYMLSQCAHSCTRLPFY